MQIDFHQDEHLKPGELRVLVTANQLTPEVVALINQLNDLTAPATDVLPVSIAGRVEMVNLTTIIAIEVFGNALTITTMDQKYEVPGQLKTLLAKMNAPQFIRIARGTAINIDHLNSLEAGFSGNMTACLDRSVRLNVSRKYLPDLKARLRM